MKRLLIILLSLLSALVLTGCATRRQLQVVDRITHDTLYQSNVHYDSIYVSQDKYIDRSRDTLLIKDKTVEYRYRLLRDTVYKNRIDSIPFIHEVEVIREVRHVPWYAKLLSWIGAIALLFFLIRVISYVLFFKKIPL